MIRISILVLYQEFLYLVCMKIHGFTTMEAEAADCEPLMVT